MALYPSFPTVLNSTPTNTRKKNSTPTKTMFYCVLGVQTTNNNLSSKILFWNILGVNQFFVQTVQTSIWTTGSTSKGYGWSDNFIINRPPLITFLQISPPTPRRTFLDIDLVAQIEVCIICTKRLICTCSLLEQGEHWSWKKNYYLKNGLTRFENLFSKSLTISTPSVSNYKTFQQFWRVKVFYI